MSFVNGNMQLVGQSPAIFRLREQIGKVAVMDAVVLVQGESGTGKELVARAIHMQSPRQQKAFVAINCGAIPESLTESILFGYEGGAFSGAHSAGQTGLLEKANGGTLFLDEAGEMPPSLQAKMLRTLQNYKIRRVGGSQVCQLDVRIVAASNRNLRDAVKSGRFREDLFYRLDVIPLIVPPLRERQGDIRLLVEFFLESYSAARGVRYEISSGLLKKFEAYAWPGNVRELKNFVEYGICFSEDGRLTKKLLEPRFALVGASECPGARVVRRRKPAFDATQLETLLRRYGRSTEGKKAAARQMGISLVGQAVLIVLFGIFASYNMFGRDYGAAVMTAGNIGWGCGSAPNAVANEKSIMDEYGWHTVAWVLYPSFAVIIDDIYNPIFLSVVSGFFAA